MLDDQLLDDSLGRPEHVRPYSFGIIRLIIGSLAAVYLMGLTVVYYFWLNHVEVKQLINAEVRLVLNYGVLATGLYLVIELVLYFRFLRQKRPLATTLVLLLLMVVIGLLSFLNIEPKSRDMALIFVLLIYILLYIFWIVFVLQIPYSEHPGVVGLKRVAWSNVAFVACFVLVFGLLTVVLNGMGTNGWAKHIRKYLVFLLSIPFIMYPFFFYRLHKLHSQKRPKQELETDS